MQWKQSSYARVEFKLLYLKEKSFLNNNQTSHIEKLVKESNLNPKQT